MLHNNRVKSYCLAKHEHLTHVRHTYLTRLFYSNHVSLQQPIIWKLGLLAFSLKLFQFERKGIYQQEHEKQKYFSIIRPRLFISNLL